MEFEPDKWDEAQIVKGLINHKRRWIFFFKLSEQKTDMVVFVPQKVIFSGKPVEKKLAESGLS